MITGTPGFLTGGFDLTVMQGDDPAAMIRLVSDGGALFTRLFASSLPVVVAAPGHAVAAGALLLLAADERIGADGSFKVGLIETQIGMFLPRWAIELAEERLSRRHFQVATVGARMYAPSDARDAGYLDAVVAPEELEATAQARGRGVGEAARRRVCRAGPGDPRRPHRRARGRGRGRPRQRREPHHRLTRSVGPAPKATMPPVDHGADRWRHAVSRIASARWYREVQPADAGRRVVAADEPTKPCRLVPECLGHLGNRVVGEGVEVGEVDGGTGAAPGDVVGHDVRLRVRDVRRDDQDVREHQRDPGDGVRARGTPGS